MIFLHLIVSNSIFIGHLSRFENSLFLWESSSSPSLPVLPLSSPLISYTFPLYPSLLLLSLEHIPCLPLPSSVITCAPTVTSCLLLSPPAHASIPPAFPFIPCMVSACSVKCVMLAIHRDFAVTNHES